MKLLKYTYEKIKGKPAPYYYSYSIFTIIGKPIRKWVAQCLAPNCVFNSIRILLYRICGFKIGKNVFIGMRCYLDDMCYNLLTIGNDVIISYGVYFACHGKNQGHYPIIVEDKAYIGMRANVISKNVDGSERGVRIGKGAVVGACALINRDVPDGSTAVGIPCRILESKGESDE